MRASRKYDVPDLLEECTARVRRYIPTTLEKLKTYDAYSFVNVVQLAILAREMALEDLFPMILYQCMAFGEIPQLFDGVEDDGKVWSLPLVDIRQCVIALDAAHRHRAEYIVPIFQNLSASCDSRKRCRGVLDAVLGKMAADAAPSTVSGRMTIFPDVLHDEWRRLLKSSTEDLCVGCSEKEEAHQLARKVFHDRLPELFKI